MCGRGHTLHSYMLSVTLTDGHVTQSSVTLNSRICLNVIPLDVFTRALTLDSSCRWPAVWSVTYLVPSPIFPVKQEQIISMLSAWRYVEWENVFSQWGDVTLSNGMRRKRGGPSRDKKPVWLTMTKSITSNKPGLWHSLEKGSGVENIYSSNAI